MRREPMTIDRRHGWWMHIIGYGCGLLTGYSLLGCTFDESATPHPDSGAPMEDAATGPDVPDAQTPDAGLPEDAECDPRASECAVGLTCRLGYIRDPAGEREPIGYCRPAGSAMPGDLCSSPGDPVCGVNQDCFLFELPEEHHQCQVICRLSDPEARCGGWPCVAQTQLGSDIGRCMEGP